MKSILIIGMGRFAHHLCMNMARLGNDILVVDQSEERVQDLLPYVLGAKIGDCTNPDVLKSLGVANFDICFVCTGSNFQSSLEITSLLKEMGAKYVVSKATRDIHAKFLLRNGADEVVYPDRDSAERAATRYSLDNIYDYIDLTGDYSIYEIRIPGDWIGKTIRELDIRNKFSINVLGVKKQEEMHMMPGANYVLKEDEHLMVMGKNKDVEKILKI